MNKCDERADPVARLVRDLTAEEMVDWLVKYKGLPADAAENVICNLREQYKWHRLQGRLDQNTTASLVAQLLLLRRSAALLSPAPLAMPGEFEYCPTCAGSLDTGWECNKCGRDWRPIAYPERAGK